LYKSFLSSTRAKYFRVTYGKSLKKGALRESLSKNYGMEQWLMSDFGWRTQIVSKLWRGSRVTDRSGKIWVQMKIETKSGCRWKLGADEHFWQVLGVDGINSIRKGPDGLLIPIPFLFLVVTRKSLNTNLT
jgi:hypothetical protein